MADNGEILDFLRVRFGRMDERFDRIEHKLDEFVTRLGRLEREVAAFHTDFAGLSVRLDNIDRRLQRVERRLDLVETPDTESPSISQPVPPRGLGRCQGLVRRRKQSEPTEEMP